MTVFSGLFSVVNVVFVINLSWFYTLIHIIKSQNLCGEIYRNNMVALHQHIISYHIISYHIISYHIISYHIISYHIISYHIISYHIISYHIISMWRQK